MKKKKSLEDRIQSGEIQYVHPGRLCYPSDLPKIRITDPEERKIMNEMENVQVPPVSRKFK